MNSCILITTGSFNPIHPLHLKNLLHVKRYLEQKLQPPWNALAGCLSPTHDSYVHSKLDNSAWIPAEVRCILCQDAIDYEGLEVSSWVTVSTGECQWPDGFVDFDPVAEKLCAFLNDTLVIREKLLTYPWRLVYVCGLDHFNKCSYLEAMAKQDNMACAVVYRSSYDEEQIHHSSRSTGVI